LSEEALRDQRIKNVSASRQVDLPEPASLLNGQTPSGHFPILDATRPITASDRSPIVAGLTLFAVRIAERQHRHSECFESRRILRNENLGRRERPIEIRIRDCWRAISTTANAGQPRTHHHRSEASFPRTSACNLCGIP
jgi:hypothetical protein